MTQDQQQAPVAQSFTDRLRAVVEARRSRRAVQEQYRSAHRELSVYTTSADLQELDAIMERSQDESVHNEVFQAIRLRAA